MGKFRDSGATSKKTKGRNIGPCGKTFGKRPCAKTRRNASANSLCKTSCSFGMK